MINKIFMIIGILMILGFVLMFRYIRNRNKQLERDCSIKINFSSKDRREADGIISFIMNNQNVICGETNLYGTKIKGYLEVIEGTEMSVCKWVKRKIPDDKISSVEVKKKDRIIVFENQYDLCEIKYRAVN